MDLEGTPSSMQSINWEGSRMIHWRPLLTTLAIGLLVAFAMLGGALHWGASYASASF
jgi:hypothetical protein